MQWIGGFVKEQSVIANWMNSVKNYKACSTLSSLFTDECCPSNLLMIVVVNLDQFIVRAKEGGEVDMGVSEMHNRTRL